jgi:hypothetical protein
MMSYLARHNPEGCWIVPGGEGFRNVQNLGEQKSRALTAGGSVLSE